MRTNNVFVKSRLAAAIGVSFLFSGSLYAEEAAGEQAEKAKEKSGLEVIQVTARKRVESVQTVPSSVNAVTGEHMEGMGVHSVYDLTKFVPGLEQPQLANHSRLSLRGVSSGDNQSFEQSVGTYVDGVYRGRMNQQRSGFFDMERVEVLKGPQVSLYGNSSVGGALSMATKRPEIGDELNGKFTVKYETEYEESQVLGGVNIPVSDEVAVRLAGKWRDQAGGAAFNHYTGKTENSYEDSAFRIGVVWEPNADLNVYLRHEQAKFEKHGETLAIYTHVNPDFTPLENSPLAAFGIGTGDLNTGNDDSIFNNGPSGNYNDSDETMLEVVWQINDSMSLTSITADSNYDYYHTLDVDMAPYNFMSTNTPEDYSQFSQELRLDTEINDQLNIMAGLYYQDADFNTGFDVDFYMPHVSTLIGSPLEFGSFSRSNYLRQNTEQQAIFTQFDYNPTDKLSLTLGVRYTDITKTATQGLRLLDIDGSTYDEAPYPEGHPFAGLTPALFSYWGVLKSVGAPHEFQDMVREEDHLMLQASASYHFSDDFMGYVNYADGAKAGGFDTLYEGPVTASPLGTSPGPSAGTPEDTEFKDESVSAWEVGFKSDWETVRLNVAAFYGVYDNLQTSIFNGSIGFNVGNAGKSIQKGVDVEFIWQATDDLKITANAEYLDFYYDEFQGAACSLTEVYRGEQGADGKCDWSGDSLAWVPEFTAVVAVEHIAEVFGDYELVNMLSVSYKSKHTVDSDNEVNLTQDGYALVDYRVTLTPADSNWHAAFTVNNLLDEDYEVYLTKIPLIAGAYSNGVHQSKRRINFEVGFNF
ncbi:MULTISPECIES: TonB-dependent receptor [Alteromonadaceae]|uniref:TonB-dependent receptor n=1 Tax=Alteromonadaceae TaxID=72275 RepID=UPI0018E8FE0C|nr:MULTISPECIES: TonB-dependent receptor [Alteromonadaceae]MBJ2130946.1 TonB-dependent receptor [Alteromonas sp. IB21]|tara:strand:+ start:16491 stop:18920 length:2430 start_codon:yes stop_codon:yes gene_type:complete